MDSYLIFLDTYCNDFLIDLKELNNIYGEYATTISFFENNAVDYNCMVDELLELSPHYTSVVPKKRIKKDKPKSNISPTADFNF